MEAQYGVTDVQMADPTWLSQDSDGDGLSNELEIAAGTNPFSVSKTITVSNIIRNGATVDLQFPTENGKLYRVEATTTLVDPNSWVMQPQPSPVQVIGDGASKTLTVPFGENTFYRIRVSDIDSDADGISDWAERAVSLNPGAAETVTGTNDHAYVLAQLALPNVVTIKAATPFASEDGPSAGKLTVTRSQNLFPTTVNLNISGTAVAGVDYGVLPTSVSFAAHGDTTANLFVNPMTRTTFKGGRSVTAALAPPSSGDFPIAMGAPSSATVIINSSIAPTGTGLLGRYYDTASGTYADAANFGQPGAYNFARGTPTTTGTIVVTYTYGDFSALQIGHLVKLSFTSGNLNSSLYNHFSYPVVAKGTSSFTVSITGAATLPSSGTGNCSFSLQSITHPAVVQRIDPTVNFDWAGGTPNTNFITPNNSPDNYSSVWEGYLSPTTAGNYTFQLDADDKARLLLDTGSGLVQILEHNWDGPATVGVFKQSAAINLAVPATPAQRYRIRVEHVETTGDARCRLQWKLNSGSFGNIPQANVYSHTLSGTYAFTKLTTNGTATITSIAHGLSNGSSVKLAFASSNLFTPVSYSGTYTVANATANTFDVTIVGSNLPASVGSGQSCYIENQTASATTGWLNRIYANTTFTDPPGRVGIDGAGAANSNNGIYGAGTPDANLIAPDTFTARWTGQVQPQFSEDYTFSVIADDGCTLWINGQLQELKFAPSSNTSGSTYLYRRASGDTVVNYASTSAKSGSFVVGESVRVDPTSGNLTNVVDSSYNYDGTTGFAVVDYSNLTNVPAGTFTVGETVELDPTSGSLSPLSNLSYVITAVTSTTFTINFGTGIYPSGSGLINVNDTRNATITKLHVAGSTYTYTVASGLTVINYAGVTSLAPSTFAVGNTVELDFTSGNLNAIGSASYVITAATASTFTVLLPAGTAGTASGNVNIAATSNGLVPVSITNVFTINFVAGRYTDLSSGNISIEFVNKPFKDWTSNGTERYVRIPMIGGTRYDIQLDYWENTGYAKCQLYWYSASLPKQIIPTERLYPASDVLAPPAQISPTIASALVNGPFSYTVAGTNGATVTVSGNPAWLTYSNGVLSGTPPPGAAGDYQILITTSNAAGSSVSTVNVHVDENGGTVPREYWSGVAGTSVVSIPITMTPTGTTDLTSLQAPIDFGDNYGARIRGYITAPVTGNYTFWIAGSDSAELWISNDDEPINTFKRAWVTTGSPIPLNWNAETNQKSPLLALDQGQRYYFEVLHKAGAGSGDSIAVGWLKPNETGIVPSQVVPGYTLSPYVPPAPGTTPGTLYVSTMLSQNGSVTTGVGSSTLRVSDDGGSAVMRYSYSGLSGGIIAQHIHVDPYLTHPSAIVFDMDIPPAAQPTPGDGLQADGSYKWTIQSVAGLSKDEIVEIIREGKAYINLHTALYPNGEIRGNYTLANGARSFVPPPAPAAWADDHATDAGASRFLTQATFGPSIADIASLKSMASYDAWIADQFTKQMTSHLAEVRAREVADVFGSFDTRLSFDAWWKSSVAGQDQLRQRVAFALSEIHVLSAQGPLEDNSLGISHFYDTLLTNAFGNFRDILMGTTLTPGMGRYLDMLRNDKPDPSVGRSPNENYAREIKQLFSIGLYRMWPDGTLMLSSKDSPIDTYSQREVVGLAHVFTGWDYGYDGSAHTSFSAATDWTRPMRDVPARHFTGKKRILNNEVLPGLATLGGQTLDPYAVPGASQIADPAYIALPAKELNAAHDTIFNHPNMGPFICRQLIQRMVTSNPSRDYLYRVVQKFNDNGAGVRGDMKTVIKAILLDYEARSTAQAGIPAFGKQREPVLRVAAAARAFRPGNVTGTYVQSGAPASGLPTITITTSAPHLLQTGNSVFLEFTDTTPGGQPAPTSGVYVVASVPSTMSYTVNAPGWILGTYNQPLGSTVMTITASGHWLPAGGSAYFDFTSGAADGLAGLDKTIQTIATSTAFDSPGGTTNVSGTTFTITASTASSARTGNVIIPRFAASYSASGGSITIDTFNSSLGATGYGGALDHHLSVGDNVFLNFINTRDTSSGNPTTTENDLVYPIVTVPDLNTFTVAARAAANSAINSDNQAYAFPLKSQPLNRNGTIVTRSSTFTLDNTDGDIGQTPLNSTTVFNFFLPDYKYPGALASQGITTPEFQGTAETTVVRHANFLYNGIFNPSNTNGISSFKTGSNALVLDLSSWMGNATDLGLGAGPQTGQVWTSNANVSTLIDRLNTLLLAGQLPATAKTIIQNYIGGQIASISTGNPCTITMGAAHGFKTGDLVTITGVTGGTFSASINNSFSVIVPANSTTTFTVPVNCTSTTTNGGIVLTSSNAGLISYTNAAPTATNIRDRLRAILHFILTSPDYTIQR